MRDAEIRFVSVEWCTVWVRLEPSLTSGGSEELRLLLMASEFRPGASAHRFEKSQSQHSNSRC